MCTMKTKSNERVASKRPPPIRDIMWGIYDNCTAGKNESAVSNAFGYECWNDKKKMTKKYWGMIATTEKKTVITALEPNSENNATKD